MAVIQTYNDSIAPSGQLNVQATPNAFGANVGQAVQQLGEAGQQYAERAYQQEVQDDVTNIHVEMAKKRAEWQQKLTDLSNQTEPGDDTLAPRVMESLRQDFESMGQSVKTRQGQQAFARMSADMTSMFGQEAVGIQARLNGEFAKNQYMDMSQSLGTVAARDYSQTESLVKQGLAAIDDPNGRFARVPEPTREAFRRSIREEIEYSAAKGFARQYPNAVLGKLPGEVRSQVQNAVANPPKPGLPPDLKADTVKPYDQSNIDSVAKRVAQPSPYDQTFKDAAQLHNLDWRELKMRAVAESNLDPNATSKQGAGGIMQFTPEMAAQLGVDRNNPTASIFAAAKLIADYRTKAGGDMSKVDMMYYGGESGTAWGANTKQYAANLAATRGAVGLGTGISPEQFAMTPTDLTGNSQSWVKPQTGIGFIDNLPADKFFAILTDAEQYSRAYDAQSERSRIDLKRQQQVAAESAMNLYTQRIVNPNQENGGALSEVEVVSNDVLDSTQKQHILSYMSQFSREKQARTEPKSNPVAMRELMLRIHAPDNDPAKIYNNEPIYQALSDGKISTSEFSYLTKEVTELRSTSTNGFRRDLNNLRGQVARTLQQNVILQTMDSNNPGVIADIAYRFDRDLENRIDALRKENKDPTVLLDPNSPDYALRPGRLQQFIPDPKTLLNQLANEKARTETAQNRAPDGGLVVGKQYVVNGKNSTYLGGPKNLRTSWE